MLNFKIYPYPKDSMNLTGDKRGDAVAWRLVHWTLGLNTMLGSDKVGSQLCSQAKPTLPSQCHSPPRSVNGYSNIAKKAWWNAGV